MMGPQQIQHLADLCGGRVLSLDQFATDGTFDPVDAYDGPIDSADADSFGGGDAR